jgi:hypothetical protein
MRPSSGSARLVEIARGASRAIAKENAAPMAGAA